SRERSTDMDFVGDRLLRAFGTGQDRNAIFKMSGPSIIIAHDLSPADTAAMVHQPVIGFITELGTRTSHTAIMARALEIPAVVGVTDALREIATGDAIIVDGLRGTVTVRPTPAEVEEARARGTRYSAHARELQEARGEQWTTKAGTGIALGPNAELPAEAILARDHGADGIGLYRTEFLYIDRAQPPSEDEQFAIFRAVVEATNPNPVVLRTFDIGGDKF